MGSISPNSGALSEDPKSDWVFLSSGDLPFNFPVGVVFLLVTVLTIFQAVAVLFELLLQSSQSVP